MLRVNSLLLAMVLALVAGCGGDPGTGPLQVKWNRAVCERCRMVLSDNRHAAQVRVRQPDGKSRVYVFDDIGCAVVWLQDKPWRDDPETELWVNDWLDGQWIDARSATYVPGQVTPMGYGLGAQPSPVAGGLDFAQAKQHIFAVEKRFHGHSPPPTPPAGAAHTRPSRAAEASRD